MDGQPRELATSMAQAGLKAIDVYHAPFSRDAKRLATLRACAALAGFALITSDDDRGAPVYVITQGALTERLGCLDAVERWLEAAGAVEVTT